ncbi:hypothetical protein NDU88_000917 [Pleurodeles waltl]|uniref:Uncharacterized protein n=1 Tax=Pleurodeles waltl TaxID=8319 RepID=A0AAV7KPK6_PLEWA|nr:hypothetical protein NDU88_000917 [Pleurodeles waltl]
MELGGGHSMEPGEAQPGAHQGAEATARSQGDFKELGWGAQQVSEGTSRTGGHRKEAGTQQGSRGHSIEALTLPGETSGNTKKPGTQQGSQQGASDAARHQRAQQGARGHSNEPSDTERRQGHSMEPATLQGASGHRKEPGTQHKVGHNLECSELGLGRSQQGDRGCSMDSGEAQQGARRGTARSQEGHSKEPGGAQQGARRGTARTKIRARDTAKIQDNSKGQGQRCVGQ